MKTNYITTIAIGALLIICLILGIFLNRTPRIAFVNTSQLVYEYAGMQEARSLFQRKASIWQANVDTVKHTFQQRSSSIQAQLVNLDKSQQEEQIGRLDKERQRMLHYSKSMAQKQKEEEEKMTQSVLNQINSFVQEYGKRNGYALILGTTTDGGILYGQDAIDLTDEILKELNAYYENGVHP